MVRGDVHGSCARILAEISWTWNARPWQSTAMSFVAAVVHLVLDRAEHGLDDLVLRRAPDQPLRGVEGVAGVELPLALRLVADELVPLVVDREDRGDGVVASLVRDELHLPVAERDGGARVGRAEVDPDDGVGGSFSMRRDRVLRRCRSGVEGGGFSSTHAARCLAVRPARTMEPPRQLDRGRAAAGGQRRRCCGRRRARARRRRSAGAAGERGGRPPPARPRPSAATPWARERAAARARQGPGRRWLRPWAAPAGQAAGEALAASAATRSAGLRSSCGEDPTSPRSSRRGVRVSCAPRAPKRAAGRAHGHAGQLGRVLHEHRARRRDPRDVRPEARRRGARQGQDHPLDRLQRLHPRAAPLLARSAT